MSNTGHHFRTAAFGGFHKQDVLNYITSANKEYREKTAELKHRTEQAEQSRSEMAEQLAAAEAERDTAAAEVERLGAALSQRTGTLETLERELTELRAVHESTAARLAELEERLPALEQGAAAFEQLKDRTATIELEAHRKAQETVEEAEARAASLRSELAGWMDRVQGSYQHLRGDITATVAYLVGELERGRTTLEGTVGVFRQHDEALDALLQSEHVPAAVPAPEPLPLEEEPAPEAEGADG